MNKHLILLAEKGMGWTIHKWQATGDCKFYCAQCKTQIITGPGKPQPGICGKHKSWDPYTSFSDAGMLMRELGIDLLYESVLTEHWEATDSDGRSNVSGRGEGNTEAAMRAAVCACAAKIIKKRQHA